MNEAIIKQQICEYAQGMLAPAEIEELELLESRNDVHGNTDIWLLNCDTGEEYWVLQGDHPANIYKKSGVYATAEHAYLAYIDMLEEKPIQEQKDRFSYL